MKLPWGTAPGADLTPPGRRLASGWLQLAPDDAVDDEVVEDDVVVAGGLVASAASATRSGWSEVDPHPAIAAAAAATASTSGRRRLIGTPALSAEARPTQESP